MRKFQLEQLAGWWPLRCNELAGEQVQKQNQKLMLGLLDLQMVM